MKPILIASPRKKIAKCLATMVCLAAANMAYATSDAIHNQHVIDEASGIDLISRSGYTGTPPAETLLTAPDSTDIAHSPVSEDMVDMGDNVQIIGGIITGDHHTSHLPPARTTGQRHNVADQTASANSMGVALTTSNSSLFNALAQFVEWETSNLIDSMQLSLISDLIQGDRNRQKH